MTNQPKTESSAPDPSFLHPTLGPYTLDSYPARQAINASLLEALPSFTGTVIDLGCGIQPYRPVLLRSPSRAEKYIGVDLPGGYHSVQPDVIWDGKTVPLPDGSANAVLLTEVLEHCPHPQQVLSELFRLLSPGGFLFLTVPFLWPLHDVPYDEFRYTPFSLSRMAEESGFEHVNVKPLGGWDASLAQMLGLWIRRRPMDDFRRRLLQRALLPVCRWLLKSDRPPVDWLAPVMITGLSMTARKGSR